jgi:hypothetical protein
MKLAASCCSKNEQVKVWDFQLQAGESLGTHRHNNDYVLIFVGDNTIRGTNADGSTRFVNEMHDGDVVFRTIEGDEDIHDAYNDGDSPSRNFIIELKK